MSNRVTSYAEVRLARQTWLWPDRIPYGQITLVAGNSDSAKSLFLADVTARVTIGAEWPDGAGLAPKGSMLVFGEDPVDSVHAPRLIAAGADLQKVGAWSGSFLLDKATDMAELRAYLAAHPDTRLVVFDPLQDYLGNAHNYRAVRSTLIDGLCAIAREFNVAVVAVGHPTKDAATTEPIHAFGGSRGIPAAARQFWYVARQENDARLLLWVKSNLSDARTGLEFKPHPKVIKRDGISIETVAVEWNPAPIHMTAAEWYALERAKLTATEPKRVKAVAMTFLRDILGDGLEHPAREILDGAVQHDIKPGSLHAAKVALGVVVRKLAVADGAWMWSWPDAPPNEGTNVVPFPTANP
jgi:hypothetical protein